MFKTKTKKRAMTEIQEDKILRSAVHLHSDLVRLECLHHTVPLLRKAGYADPDPLRSYIVHVSYRDGGLMRVAPLKKPSS